ncbi:MAG: ATP-dependent helicase [Candidatus Nanopelagicales bacterium]|nr:ATP-dependent helicase [Candidatus Nanopelagicales bacterium]
MTEISRAELDSALGLTLTDEQWGVVSRTMSPAVIVAGAGSGKTTSMSARVAWLVASEHVRPDEVLGLTFTTKAAGQLLTSMRGAVDRLLQADVISGVDDSGEPIGEPEVLTYHAFAARILSEHGIRIGREPEALVLTDEARRQLAYRFVCRSSAPLSAIGRGPVAVTSDLLHLDDELTELAIDPAQLRTFDRDLVEWLRGHERDGGLQVIGRDMLATSTSRSVMADLVDEWRAEKAVRDVIDFADQIRLAGQIVARFPEVVAELRTRYATVLLDEYQDTSIAQRELLQRIFGGGHPVLAVGDPCQAIYGWRGASVDNIESFPRHFPAREDVDGAVEADRHALSLNRRSGPTVLDVANRVSQRLRSVHRGVEPLSAGDNGKGPGAVTCALFETYADEVDWVVHEIQRTHASGRVPWQDIAVLAATSRDLVAVEAALRRRGVPTHLAGSAALLSQPAVIDLRSMLEVIHDPCANPAFVRLASGPRWAIGARDLAALGARAAELAGGRSRGEHADLAQALDEAVAGTDIVEAVSLTEALMDLGDLTSYSPAATQRFREMADEIASLRRHAGEPLPDFILRVMRTSGIEVEAALRGSDQADHQLHALHALVDLSVQFNDVDGRIGLGAFLSRLQDAERFEVDLDFEVAPGADAVSLLTVHKAKGLEFPYVFVPFVSENSFPGGRGRPQWTTSPKVVPWPLRPDTTPALSGFPRADEAPRAKHHDAYLDDLRFVGDLENDRLAYVAFTRAERGLAVSGHWWGPFQKTLRGPSRFLTTVHEACVDGAGEVAHWAPEPGDDDRNPQLDRSRIPRAWPAVADDDYRRSLRQVAERMAAVVQTVLFDESAAGDPSRIGPAQAQIAEWDHQWSALLEEERSRRSEDRVVRLPRSVSVSTLMRALADPQATARDIARPVPSRPSEAARRGTQFHAWVEARYGQQSLLDPDDLPGAADSHISSDADLAELKEAFERSAYVNRTPVGIEVPFSLLVHGRVVNGRIDAVFSEHEHTDDDSISGARFEVVDWKTGSGYGTDPMQLALYRLAWAQLASVPVEQVSAAFLLVATGEVIRPETDALIELLLT